METIFVIFALGFVVTLVVAKGLMQASEFASEELEKLENPGQDKAVPK